MLPHLFQSIYTVFRSNTDTKCRRKEPISTKKLGQGDAAWATTKTVPGWGARH